MLTYLKQQRGKWNKEMIEEMILEAKWLYQYTGKYWGFIIYYILLGMLGIGMGLAASVASKYLIDVVTGYDSSNIVWIVSILIVMTIGSIMIGAVTSRLSTKINLEVQYEIQVDVYSKLMKTEWEALSDYHSGDLLNRLHGDVSTVAESVLGWVPSLITKLFQFIGTFAIILYYDSTMAVISLLSAPITILMSKMLMTRMRDHNKSVREISSEILAFHEESVQNIQHIKGLNIVDLIIQRLQTLQAKYVNMTLEYNKFFIYTTSFLSVVGLATSYSAFGWGVYRLWSGAITYGTMTLFLQLSGKLSSSFSALLGMVPEAIGATTAAGRIMAIVNLPKEKEADTGEWEEIDYDINRNELSLHISDVYFGYRGREPVLEGVNLKAKPNEIVAIIGPSGEGKTTLFRLLLGLINPTSGSLSLYTDYGDMIDVSAASRKYFSYVPQGNTIFSGTIADNLRMVQPNASEEEMIAALKAACAYDFVKELPGGIHARVGEKGCGLSEGQAQRIAIARALLKNTPILLMDEATSALDADTEKEVLQAIMSYGKTHTCILTTHRVSVAAICDRVYQIRGTRMIELPKKAFYKGSSDVRFIDKSDHIDVIKTGVIA